MPSCSRPSRSGRETPPQAAPPPCRPSLTAARHDGAGNVQAGTERCSRPNQKITPERRTQRRQTRYPDPNTSLVHETGASPIFRWGRRLTPEALALFGIERAPCHATYHYFFKSLDGDVLARVLGEFARGNGEPCHIAIDGKTLKGSRRLNAKALHVVSAFATQLSCVVGDLVVAPDQNEITAALALLKDLPLEGSVITGDAIFCQREICRTIKDRNGDYLFVVKDNQPQLKADIAESFGDLSPLTNRQRRR